MRRDLTQGPVLSSMVLFALPLMAGNILQQLYNITDSAIVGRFVGPDALAAVGSAYSLMTFITSIIIGLCLGSGALFALHYGRKDDDAFKRAAASSFIITGLTTVVLMAICLGFNTSIVRLLNTPEDISAMLESYLWYIYLGIPATLVSNCLGALMRSTGDSRTPLVYFAVSVVLNIILDLVFVVPLGMGVDGAAIATVISQYVSAIGLLVHCLVLRRGLLPSSHHWHVGRRDMKEVFSYSYLTCLQQSVMNFGILMIQGLVNSFGVTVMAAFAAAVKVDSFAYLPVQDFGNAYSFFISQNRGAGKADRVARGTRDALLMTCFFSLLISLVVNLLAHLLMGIFVDSGQTAVIDVGVGYLRIEGSFYILIAILFLLYGHFRAVGSPGVSLLLTVLSLGTRVALAYALAPSFGYLWIWASIPIGWAIADAVGLMLMRRSKTS